LGAIVGRTFGDTTFVIGGKNVPMSTLKADHGTAIQSNPETIIVKRVDSTSVSKHIIGEPRFALAVFTVRAWDWTVHTEGFAAGGVWDAA
jgi:hypothetical protein